MMTSFFKNIALKITHGFLTLCAFLFVALIAIQIILVVGINAISTGAGTDFIADKINQSIATSSYNVDFDGLYYDPVRGISVHDLTVSDDEGPFLSVDRFSIAASFMLSPLRTLELFAKGGTLTLDRLPVSEETAEPDMAEPLQPFATPDIYFRKIILNGLSFDKIILGESVAGSVYELSPSLRASISLQDEMTLSATLEPGLTQLVQGLASPKAIKIDAALIPSTLVFTLGNLSVSAQDYSLTAQGQGTLGKNGVIDLTAKVQHENLSILTTDAIKAASMNAAVKGPLSGPAIDLTADIVTGSLKERGLSDIKVSLKTEDIAQGMKGDARIETAYRNDPVAIDAAIAYEVPAFHISDLKGTAPDITVTGGGTLSTDTFLFDGTIKVDAGDLARYSELAGITLGGSLKADATLTPSDGGEQSADIKAEINNGVADTVTVRRLNAQATIASLSNPWPNSAKLDASAIKITDDINLNKLSAAITAQGDERYSLTVNGNGAVPMPVSFDGMTSLSNLTQSVPDLGDIVFTVKQGASSVKLSGDLTTESVNLALSAKGFRGQDIPADLPSQLNELRIDLDAAMTGAPAQPNTTLAANLRGLGKGIYESASLDIKAQHEGQTLTASLAGKGTGIRKLGADISAPMELSLIPFHFAFDQSAPLDGTIAADIDLAAIAQLFLPPTQELSGTLIANGTITGTVANPAPTADIRLSDAAFEDSQSGIVIADLSANASMNRESLRLTSLSGTDGGAGTIAGGGNMSFSGGATDLNLQLRNFNAPRSTIANGIVSADMTLKGAQDGLLLSGSADITEMNITIPETFASSIPQLNIVEDDQEDGPGLLDRLALDITINANNQVFVRGWGLDAEFEGTIAVDGTASAPQMNGTLSSRRGRYEEFGKRFTLAKANLRFQGAVPPSPYLDIEATTPAGDVTGSILLTGPATAPSITFASTPSLPEDEVLSRILFGKDSANISPFQAVQLAQTIRRFSGQGGAGLDPLGMLRDATGLDDISVDTDESGATNVNVGKYLTDNVYLELGSGKAEDSGEATIEIEVTPSITIESEIGQDAQGGGGVFWKRDY